MTVTLNSVIEKGGGASPFLWNSVTLFKHTVRVTAANGYEPLAIISRNLLVSVFSQFPILISVIFPRPRDFYRSDFMLLDLGNILSLLIYRVKTVFARA
ncbi:MAG: hypothetical protein QMD03_09270 [Syntrophales bacterium]|nr:hypothetical protein [Syntrophales bacterium]